MLLCLVLVSAAHAQTGPAPLSARAQLEAFSEGLEGIGYTYTIGQGGVAVRAMIERDLAPVLIGEDVTVGHAAVLHACTIGDRCLVGMGAIVMDGAILEPDSMIAGGAVVPPGKTVASGTLWRGNPARCARDLSQAEVDYLRYSAHHYVRLKDQYLETGSP